MIDPRTWFGQDDDDENDPVKRTLRYLGMGVDTATQAASDIGTGISSAASSAGEALGSGLSSAAEAVSPYLAAPGGGSPVGGGPRRLEPDEPSMLEQLPQVASEYGRAASATLGDRGAMLAGLRPPETPEEVMQANAPAPVRAGRIVSEVGSAAMGAALGEYGERAAGTEPTFVTNEIQTPLGTIPSVEGPTPRQVGSAVGSVVGDPTNWILPGTAADKAADVAIRGLAGAAGQGVRAGAGAAGSAIGRAAEPLIGAFRGNAGRVAAADARMAAEGGTSLPATLGGLPEPGGAGRPTVEVLQERLDTATASWQRAREAGDERMAALAREHAVDLESQLVDAQNARRQLEPAITSDVGRRVESLPLAEETADTLSGAGSRVADVHDLSGPLSIPTDLRGRMNVSAGTAPETSGAGALSAVNRALGEGIAGGVGGAVIEQGRNPDEDPRTAAARGFAVGAVGFPAATRLARGAARLAGAGTDVGGGARIALGDVPPSQIRRPQLPGMAPAAPGAVAEDFIPPGPGARPADAPGTAPGSGQAIGDALPEIIRQLNAPPPAVAREGASLPLVAATPGRTRLAANTAARLISGGLNKVQTARIAGMLSDTAGQLANVAGGPVLQAIDITTGPIAAALDVGRVAGMRAVGKQASREVFFSETGERLKGMARGGSIGLGRSVDVLRGGLDAGEAAKLEQRGGFGTNIPGIAPKGSKAAGVADFAVEAPLRALGAADAVFKTSAQGGHLMAEAYAAARKANGGKSPSPEQIRAAAQLPEVLERVQYLSSRSVLQEDRMLTNWYKRAMNYRSDDPTEQAAADLLKAGLAVEIPFVRTPYNVVAQGMGMTPAGVLGLIQDVKQGKAAREMEQRLARVMLGTAIMAPVAAGVGEGRFTGPYPETEKERSLLPPGWRPWSAKVDAPNGETYYLPLSYAQGLAMPIVMGLLAREAYKKDGWSLEAAGKVAAGVGEYAAQETFLEGFGAIGKLFDSKASPATWQREAEQIAASYVPFSALGREMQRVMGMPARDPEGWWEAIQATNPLTAGNVEPRQDVLGREASLGLGGPAGAVVRAGVENDTGVLRAFRRAGEGLPMQAPDSIPDPDTGRARTLTEHQQHRWRRVFGRELRSAWSDAGAPSDAESLRAIEADARQAANDTLMGRR